jgi:hypothetical protein
LVRTNRLRKTRRMLAGPCVMGAWHVAAQ